MPCDVPHSKFCRDDCPVARNGFYEQVEAVAKQVLRKIAPRLGLPENCSVRRAPHAPPFLYSVELFDSYHGIGRKSLVLGRFPRESREHIGQAFIVELAGRAANAPQITPESLLFLVACTMSKNCAKLANVLESFTEPVPTCCIQVLLRLAIHEHSPPLVFTLLNHGASPDKSLVDNSGQTPDYFSPIVNSARRFQVLLLGIADDGGFNSVDFNPQTAPEFCQVLGMLIEKASPESFKPAAEGAINDEAPSRDPSNFWACLDIANVACFSPQLAQLLMERCGPYFGFERADSAVEFVFIFMSMFIASAFYEKSALPNDELLGLQALFDAQLKILLKMLHFGIAPLIRSGLRSEWAYPENFCDEQLKQLNCLLSLFGDCGKKVMEVIVGLLVESTNADPVDLSFLGDYLDEDEMQSPCVKQLRHSFPRSLQRSARRTILSQLPLGLQARNEAIKKLDLPQPLECFLKFAEFDVLPSENGLDDASSLESSSPMLH